MKNTLLRGKILRLLFELYPNGIEHTQLVGIYYQYEKVEEIERSVSYLVDRKLVARTVSPHPFKANATVTYYKITPEGIDLIDGTDASDSGIVVPVEA